MLRRQLLLRAKVSSISRCSPPSQQAGRAWQRRHASGEAGEGNTGHINVAPSEGVLFFNNLLPLTVQWPQRMLVMFTPRTPVLTRDQRFERAGAASPSEIVQNATKGSNLGLGPVTVVEVLPRINEAGAFLKFSHDESTDPATVAEAVRQHLKKNKIRPWWNPFTSVKAMLVLGKPWIEDLYRLPSRRLRVEFFPTQPGKEAAELSQEQLYSFFRPYGKLSDIVAQPSDSKVVPRYAYLDFTRIGKAVMAKNCLHGYTVTEAQGGGQLGTMFRLTYEKKQRTGWIWDWLLNHPRVVIPALAALIAGLSVTVFDPIRTLSIRAHITRAFHIEDNVVFRWFKTQSDDLISKVQQFRNASESDEGGMQVVWDDRKPDIEQIQSWLMETADTFIIVQGPRGSGKRELVIDHALEHKRAAHKVLVIDCKPIQEARGDAATIAAAAGEVGYRPVFSWVNNISGLMDLAAQGMTGMKAGFSETLENQLLKIWSNTTVALKSIALESRNKKDTDANLSDDEWLEAHPECRPVVVIDNFLHKSTESGSSMVYDKLAEYAARLTTSNIAHVIFLTNDVSFSKSLSKALPDRVFRQIALQDCSLETAKRYVIQHLDFDAVTSSNSNSSTEEPTRRLTPSQQRADLRELDHIIPLLGGRLTDLEFLARRIKAGETPTKAVNEIIDQSSSEILKMFLLLGASGGSGEDRAWTPQQAWTLVRSLATSDTLRFNEVLLLDAYKTDGEKALAALEQAELIAVQSSNGRPYSIKPGKPVYQPAFQRLVGDHVLAAKMDLAVLAEGIGIESKTIEKLETELHLLGELPRQPGELSARIGWLLGKIAGSQRRIEGFERESAGLKKVLSSEY
ncbi:mitochondrial escape protein 2 [Friedmanniomyces endolithicus]|nr:mitochondrial escape protein 2 [Friedmanniomyces endolithicus]KAK0286522.1 mitochondrial escape protein 2 [Friedmanniomyces endolithicus]KAK1015391.1 mitochondrial escape protein 2 [Friedmanniomyces endolithicus]KAK1029410.1 mitochondrial escape protein 2 [Friedmanniomyces endolithicus]